MSNTFETATFAGGCFWCAEALFLMLRGVRSVFPGYSGGVIDNPTYEQVSTGTTGHAEAVQIEFDPEQISFESLLDVFWHTHDPTTLNMQGHDVGTQYRSAVFFHGEQQRKTAIQMKNDLDSSGEFPHPIVTEIIPYVHFYVAEDYHKNYFARNQNQPYCQIVITPKIHELISKYEKLLIKG